VPVSVIVAPIVPEIGDTAVNVGALMTVIELVLLSAQLKALVTVTEYVVLIAGDTTIAAVVAPVFHRYKEPELAVRVADDPLQTVPSLETPEVSVIVMVGVVPGLPVQVPGAGTKPAAEPSVSVPVESQLV
jgi:hypothetical protein